MYLSILINFAVVYTVQSGETPLNLGKAVTLSIIENFLKNSTSCILTCYDNISAEYENLTREFSIKMFYIATEVGVGCIRKQKIMRDMDIITEAIALYPIKLKTLLENNEFREGALLMKNTTWLINYADRSIYGLTERYKPLKYNVESLEKHDAEYDENRKKMINECEKIGANLRNCLILCTVPDN